MKKLTYILLLGMLTVSCVTKTFESMDTMWEFLNDPVNEYTHTKTVNGVDFSVIYKPTDLLVAQEYIDGSGSVMVDSLRNKYSKYLYFNVSMSRNNQELLSNVAGNKQQFGAMVNELAFGMEQKVHFYTQKKDTIAMTDYIYPRMYGMSGATTILLVYPREELVTNAEEMTLVIEDLGFYTGEVKFKIPTEVFENQPELEFK